METIYLNKKIYSLLAINSAVEAFSDIANFKIKELNDKIEVKISKIDKDVKGELKDEFLNYVLALMS
jgi:anaerobic ribonucleoside-triphosphate reductase